jgi:hypothetical protein
MTAISDKEEFEEDEAISEKEFLESYIANLKSITRKHIDRFSKYEYLNNRLKLFRVDKVMFDYMFDYVQSFKLLKTNIQYSGIFIKIEFFYLKIYFKIYDWFYFILRTNYFFMALNEKITKSFF